MIPGAWIDGFRANTDSKVFKNHPEYFLHDQDGNIIVQVRKPEGPDRDRVYLDYSHPGARAHMAECIRVITKEMGIPYLKIDFIRLGLNQEILQANPTFKSIKPYNPAITDVERMRLGLQTMREAAGPDIYILGCSAVFGPCIGFVDGMRTGGDVSPRYEAFPERVLANAGNSCLSGKVFNGDADYLVFREAADEDEFVSQEKVKHGGSLTINEAQMWADFNKLYGNCRLSSDKLKILRHERQALVKEVFEIPAMDETVPLDFWQHGKDKGDGYELILARHAEDIYIGIFNWSEATKEYNLPDFEGGIQKLDARHSRVLKYAGSLSFNELRKTITASLSK
jgi:alpha-galactosidase